MAISVIVIITALPNSAWAQGEEENGSESKSPILFGGIFTGIFLLTTAALLYLVKRKAAGRDMNRKLWSILCGVLCFGLPVALPWVGSIVAFADTLCFILMLGSGISVTFFIVLFYLAHERSVMIIEDFPDEFKVVISKGWKTYLVAGMFALGVCFFLLGIYMIYREGEYLAESLEGLAYLIGGGIVLIVLSISLWKKWVTTNEIMIDRYKIRRLRGEETRDIPWENITGIKFDTKKGGNSRYYYVKIHHTEGKEKVSNVDITDQNEFERFFFAILYNHRRSGVQATLKFKEKWAKRWGEGYIPQIRKLTGEAAENDAYDSRFDCRYEL